MQTSSSSTVATGARLALAAGSSRAAVAPWAPRCAATRKQTTFVRPSKQLLGQARDVAAAVALKWAEEEVSEVGFNTATGISVCSHFDSGNVDIVDISNPQDLRLRIHSDPYTEKEDREHFQWFYFRVAGAKNQPLRIRLVNAQKASFPNGWAGYQARASYDRKRWFQVPTTYDESTGLALEHTPQRDAVYYAYWAPYTYEMHQQLIASLQDDDRVCMKVLGQTHDGHDIELLRIGTKGEKSRKIWITARQHPGETMGEYFVEGLLRRLLDRDEALSRKLLAEAEFYVVPCMNPDGCWRGHLCTNAEGFNLNRHWDAPDAATVPEVYHVLKKMEEIGVDMYIDVHGDEVINHNYLHGNEAIPSWDDRLSGLQDRFRQAFHRMDPTFSTIDSFGMDGNTTADMSVAQRVVGEKFKCLAFTVEMPFKDSEEFPDEECGWSAVRSQHFGASILNAVADVLPNLR